MKKINNVLRYAAIAACVVVIASCDGFEFLDKASDDNEWRQILNVTESIKDGEGESTGELEETVTVQNGDETSTLNPTVSVTVELAKKSIEVDNTTDLLSEELISEETISDESITENGQYGRKVVKQFTYRSGQVATATAKWLFDKLEVAGTSVSGAHVEISDISYNGFSNSEATENSCKSTLAFQAKWVAVNADAGAGSGIIDLKPWYTKTLKQSTPDIPDEPTDSVGETIWSHNLVWNVEEGTVTITVTKTVPHTLIQNEVTEWSVIASVFAGRPSDTKFLVGSSSVSYETSVEDDETSSRTEGVFTLTQTIKKYGFEPHYLNPDGSELRPYPELWIKVASVEVVFNNGEKLYNFNIPLKLNFTQAVKKLEGRDETYQRGSTVGQYGGTDVRNFSVVDTEQGVEVMNFTAYTDLYIYSY